jgi:hypothetical protein
VQQTLTAESVAEIAEKLLYRVTCGNIGTAPDAVEKDLEISGSCLASWKDVGLRYVERLLL